MTTVHGLTLLAEENENPRYLAIRDTLLSINYTEVVPSICPYRMNT